MFPIEKGIEITKRGKNEEVSLRITETLLALKEGESFLIPYSNIPPTTREKTALRNRAFNMTRKFKNKTDYRIRITKEGIRVWYLSEENKMELIKYKINKVRI